MKIKNPVLTGFHADPSIVRVGETYYIANSTFEWFPGVQIYESQDLMNWRLVARPLASVEMLDMKGNEDSGGFGRPISLMRMGNFWLDLYRCKSGQWCVQRLYKLFDYCRRDHWSMESTDPVERCRLRCFSFSMMTMARKYLVQMEWDHREYHHPFKGIKCTEYSVEEQRLLPETSEIIWKGTDVKLVEGPHLYKLFGYYYLFCAEGGTVYTHQEVVARSKL